MPAQIIDFTSVRLLRRLDTLRGSNDALQALARDQVRACRQAEQRLGDLHHDLTTFVRRLDEHRTRCDHTARRLRRSVEALESGDVDRMIAARDDLRRHMAHRRPM
ncbi:hypothetical protein [Caenispirillum bisanense]|uniref:Uncharacterized protein n=1 Tax=Caenispirillum bisanense TaxID=414052 RepID=A0A286GLI9_9PROT|nr:hypothetical protein [Caenispirillum bisanense]SOD96046.1 hypothetical protein SAMN05421508_105128 [Caenispirillum bisanense]